VNGSQDGLQRESEAGRHPSVTSFAPSGDVQFRAVSRSRPPDIRVADADDAWRLNELVRRRRLREQARRSLAANLAEGLALSEFLSKFRGAARR
jgi:hypothetical protein